MIQRCTNPKHTPYPYYGGRGITVCNRWRESFEAFLADMGERPAGTSLDRVDNDGNYEPGNCRWATQDEQNRNRQDVRYLTHNGRTMTVGEWARHLGVHRSLLWSRVNRGWSDDRIVGEAAHWHRPSRQQPGDGGT